MKTEIVIFDYGSQYTQLLARRIRELNYYAEIVNSQTPLTTLKNKYPDLKVIILSGGPNSVYETIAPKIDLTILKSNYCILGVCYGMQLLVQLSGGTIELAKQQEFGASTLNLSSQSDLFFENVKASSSVWMSHADHVIDLGNNWDSLASSENSIAVIKHKKLKHYGVQFHLEVTETQFGLQMLKNFLEKIAKLKPNWFLKDLENEKINAIKTKVGSNNVILGLSGGVDSSVTAVLISKAIGQQLKCIFIDNGLLRKNEAATVLKTYKEKFNLNLIHIDASQQFYQNLANITDPEQKRKIIGATFIKVFNEACENLNGVKFLAQGTIYPDVIESSQDSTHAKVIKSHHNVGGLPPNMKLQLLEPLKDLFKDEVRKLGEQLGLPNEIIYRHPFPGPGLAIRILGAVTAEKCQVLQAIDEIFITALKQHGYYQQVSQAATILLPVQSVGVMGDNRTYKHACVLRAVQTIDFMTAQICHLPWQFLEMIATKIINEVTYVNRVVYDLTSKPPGTIEWE